MSIVTFSLRNLKHAPWGLLTEEERPQPIVWLTEMNPIDQIDHSFLSESDIIRAKQGEAQGFIIVEGLSPEFKLSQAPKYVETTPILSQPESKLASQETIMDVATLIKEENERAKEIEKKVVSRGPKVEEFISLPAHKLKKEIKRLAKEGTYISFFQACRTKEVSGKNRKSVIAVLIEVIQAQIAAIGVDRVASKHSGQTILSNAYYDMIEEFEDEDKEY